MAEPKIEDLRKKADSKFALVMGAAKRTRQIIDFMSALGRGDSIDEATSPPDMNDIVDKKPVMIALKEISQNRILIVYPENMDEEPGMQQEAEAVLEGETEAGVLAEEQTEEEMKEAAARLEAAQAAQVPDILKTKEDKKKERAATKAAVKKAEPAVKTAKAAKTANKTKTTKTTKAAKAVKTAKTEKTVKKAEPVKKKKEPATATKAAKTAKASKKT